MGSPNKTPEGTVKDTGALATSILIGVDDHNRGLRIQIDEDQEQSGKTIVGAFDVLDAGNGKYANAFEPHVGKRYESAKDMIADVQNTANTIEALRDSEPTHFLLGSNLKVEK